MVVINARVFSSEYIMVSERETSKYPDVGNIIWDVEGISPYRGVTTDIAPWAECGFVSWHTRGKGGVVPHNIPLSRRLRIYRWAKDDAINVKGWPNTNIA